MMTNSGSKYATKQLQSRLEDFHSQATYYLNKLTETCDALESGVTIYIGNTKFNYIPKGKSTSHVLTKELAISFLQSDMKLDSIMRNKIAAVLRGDTFARYTYTDAEIGGIPSSGSWILG